MKMEIVRKYEKHLQEISPIFNDVEQEYISLHLSNDIITADSLIINGYEFAKKFIRDERYNHLFKDITFQYIYYDCVVFVNDEEICSGIELLSTIKDDLNAYNKIEDLAHYFFGNELEGVSLETFLDTILEFNNKFEDAIDALDIFIEKNEDKLLSMEV